MKVSVFSHMPFLEEVSKGTACKGRHSSDSVFLNRHLRHTIFYRLYQMFLTVLMSYCELREGIYFPQVNVPKYKAQALSNSESYMTLALLLRLIDCNEGL